VLGLADRQIFDEPLAMPCVSVIWMRCALTRLLSKPRN